MSRYQDLRAWQLAMDLADLTYDIVADWPVDERFGLTSQTRRAAVSIPANIAEGQGRSGPQEFRYHLSVAYGSLCELETLMQLATRRNYVPAESLNGFVTCSSELGKVINGLMRSLDRIGSKP